MILVQLTNVSCLLVASPEYWLLVALSQVFVPVAVPPPVAKSPSDNAVLNCAIVHVIPTILVWSPVLLPLKVVIHNLVLIVLSVSSPVLVQLWLPRLVRSVLVSIFLVAVSTILSIENASANLLVGS